MRKSLLVMLGFAALCSTVVGQSLNDSLQIKFYRLETISQQPVCNHDNVRTALILSFGLSCSQCHTVLEQAIDIIDSTYSIVVGVRTGSRNSIERRKSIQWVQRLVKTRQIFLMRDLHSDSTCAFIVKEDIGDHSPCLVILDKGKWTATVPYDVMFDPNDESMPSPQLVADRIVSYLRL